MTKKELLAYRSIKKELNDLEKRIEELRKDARSPKGISYSDMPRGRSEPIPSQQRYIEQLEKLSDLYEERKAKLVETQIAIERAISSLPSELRLLMQYRYIDGMRWEEIAEIMHISIGTFHNWHNKALLLLKD
mgnify:FL=1